MPSPSEDYTSSPLEDYTSSTSEDYMFPIFKGGHALPCFLHVSNFLDSALAPICFLLLWVVTCLIYHTLHLLSFASCFFAWLIAFIFFVLLHLSKYKRCLPSLSVLFSCMCSYMHVSFSFFCVGRGLAYLPVLFSCILSYMHVSLSFFSVHGTFVVVVSTIKSYLFIFNLTNILTCENSSVGRVQIEGAYAIYAYRIIFFSFFFT